MDTAEVPGARKRDKAGSAGLLVLYTITSFLSAFLLFLIQPMFTKMVLPILGGSPSVWAVALVFFQTALLAGYAYAHILTRLLSPLIGGIIHIGVLLTAVFFLPIAVPDGCAELPLAETSEARGMRLSLKPPTQDET